ncbi:hypothetical protein CA267_015175 [Alteromonas pelagimontana]|uniref:Uncharacterized protein n=1 Tax=Alteromonas pelagimontana TaxID=1858656 RepID=A0A6M4MGJ8_9ALTE|nr:hypothetical protein [Alteromonas pelagimontana]QJR81998.1 hypothetical protein CA267_015175 [Alteromonas pelagimontana]
MLAKRQSLQELIDDYHRRGDPPGGPDYKSFLQKIGYPTPQPDQVNIDVTNVDPEIANHGGAAVNSEQLTVELENGASTTLCNPEQWLEYRHDAES